MKNTQDGRRRFADAFKICLRNGTWRRLTLSVPLKNSDKNTDPKTEARTVTLRPVATSDGVKVSLLSRFQTRDETQTLEPQAAVAWVGEALGKTFANADFFANDADWLLKYFPKQEKWHLRRKAITPESAQDRPVVDLEHNREKNRLLSALEPWLTGLGITGEPGTVKPTMQAKWRQMNKFVETVEALRLPQPSDRPLRVVDMGCGKGYLTFALHAHLLSKQQGEIRTTGVELRHELVGEGNALAQQHGLAGLDFVAADIATVLGEQVDVLIALHACDTATDLAIASGIKGGAEVIIVAPCCHKQVRRSMSPPPALLPMLRHGILLERQAEMVTDAVRALLLEANGYRTKVFEFISPDHTPKNVMITAEKVVRQGKLEQERKQQAQDLLSLHGVSEHALCILLTK